MEPDIAGVLKQFESIKKHANQLYQNLEKAINLEPSSINPLVVHSYHEEVESLVEDFKNAKTLFDMIKYKQKFDTYLRYIEITERIDSLGSGKQKALLRKLDIECDKAIGVLESIATPLSKEELDKLTSLRKELEKLSGILDINYGRNFLEAINEYEKEDYLASALISSRVIIYALEQIPGKTDEVKVKFLQEREIIEKGRKDVHESIIKASRKARNFFSHDIKVFPTPSEALSLLSDAMGILEKVSKFLKEVEIEK